MSKINSIALANEIAKVRAGIEGLNEILAELTSATAKPVVAKKAAKVAIEAAPVETTVSAGTIGALRAHVGRAKKAAIGTIGTEHKAIMAIVADRQAKVDAALAGREIVKTPKVRAAKAKAEEVKTVERVAVAPTSLAAYRAHLSRAKIAAEQAQTLADYKAAMAKVEEKAAFIARLTA